MSIKGLTIAGTLGVGAVIGYQAYEDSIQDDAVAQNQVEQKAREDGWREQEATTKCRDYVRTNVNAVGTLEERVRLKLDAEQTCREITKTVE